MILELFITPQSRKCQNKLIETYKKYAFTSFKVFPQAREKVIIDSLMDCKQKEEINVHESVQIITHLIKQQISKNGK